MKVIKVIAWQRASTAFVSLLLPACMCLDGINAMNSSFTHKIVAETRGLAVAPI